MFATVAGVARLIVLKPVKFGATDVTTKEGNVSTARARLVKEPIAEMKTNEKNALLKKRWATQLPTPSIP